MKFSKLQRERRLAGVSKHFEFLDKMEFTLDRSDHTPRWKFKSTMFQDIPVFLKSRDTSLNGIMKECAEEAKSRGNQRALQDEIKGIPLFFPDGIRVEGVGKIIKYNESFLLVDGVFPDQIDTTRLLALWNHEMREKNPDHAVVQPAGLPLPVGNLSGTNIFSQYGNLTRLPESSALYPLSEVIDAIFPESDKNGIFAVII